MRRGDSDRSLKRTVEGDFPFSGLPSLWIKHPCKFPILEIPQLPGDDWSLPGEEEQLQVLRQIAHLVGGEERAADVVLAERDSGFLAVERKAHWLKDDRLLAEEIRNHSGALLIVDPENLQNASVGEEGSCARTVGRAQLMDILQDRPELNAIAGHEREGALNWRQRPEGGEFIEEIEDRRGRPDRRPGELGEALRHEQAQPARIGREPIGRQHKEDCGRAFLQISEAEIRAT
jgi:hypothetical protein